jgi:hypothetical protein
MIQNLFEDIGYDLVEKFPPPAINKIIEMSTPLPNSNLPATTGSKTFIINGFKVVCILTAAYVGYKIWEWKKEKDRMKRGY